MQWARMQPPPLFSLIFSIDSKQASHMNFTPWPWCGFSFFTNFLSTEINSSFVSGSKSNTNLSSSLISSSLLSYISLYWNVKQNVNQLKNCLKQFSAFRCLPISVVLRYAFCVRPHVLQPLLFQPPNRHFVSPYGYSFGHAFLAYPFHHHHCSTNSFLFACGVCVSYCNTMESNKYKVCFDIFIHYSQLIW